MFCDKRCSKHRVTNRVQTSKVKNGITLFALERLRKHCISYCKLGTQSVTLTPRTTGNSNFITSQCTRDFIP